ncbi:hypothetical protein O181_025602 [Austropuccinia psidii MF-1]|uniref:Uncharacterized protein n=1 Tax=Austropuccinia psidii MF-1 TaxID=1389203 RepID=A0A9Q3CLI3_9BASI|nr:hypothetical protein [Austropuccinia psidii MF-1]
MLNSSPTYPPAQRFHSQVIPSTQRNEQPVLSPIPSSIPSPSPNPSTVRPALASPLRPSPITHPRPSAMITSHQLQPVINISIRNKDRLPLPFTAAQVSHRIEYWPFRATREDSKVVDQGEYSVASLFRRIERNSREVIMYANDR